MSSKINQIKCITLTKNLDYLQFINMYHDSIADSSGKQYNGIKQS